MMDFRRWVKRATPQLVLTGALVAGLSGCQSAQNLAPSGTTLSSVPAFEQTPLTPALPDEDIPQLPAPAPGVDSAVTGTPTKSTLVPPPREPNFEPPAETEVQVVTPEAKPNETSIGEPEATPAATVETTPAEVKPTETPAEATAATTPQTLPDTGKSETAAGNSEGSNPETKPIEPVFEEPTFEGDPTATTTEPVDGPETGTTETPQQPPTLPLTTEPEEPAGSTRPLALPVDPGGEPLPTPAATAPRLPDSLPLEVPEQGTTSEETTPQKTAPTVTKSDTDALPEKVLPETKPETEPETVTKPEPTATTPAETKSTEPPTPVEKPIPFSGSGEATVPAPIRRPVGDTKSKESKPNEKPLFDEPEGKSETDESPDESLELPEFEEPIKQTASGANGRPFIQLPEITPGPTQPTPAETPLGSVLPLPRLDEPSESREVASIRSPNGTLPELPEARTDSSVRGVEIASFGGTADGIVFDAEGTAFVSHRDSISKVKLDGEVTHWVKTGAPRGHAILRDGTHLICDASERAVLHLDQDGKLLRKVVTKSDGYFLRAPNDLVVDASGGFYFTDPGYARIRNAIGKVHYVAADGTVSVVAQKLAFPEGIALSADGAKLLVAESQNNRIVEFEILSPGEIGSKEVFCKLPDSASGDSDNFVDGLAVDREGQLYVAHRGMSRIEVIGPDGDWRTSFSCPDTIVQNLAFSRDYSKLFVTGTDRKRRAGRLLIIDFAASR